MKVFFGPGGCFQSHDKDFSYRPGQLQMSEAIQEAIEQSSNLAVEGGTGVGKSLAYLVPALQAAWHQKKKVMISTWSISLQQQLVEKDIPWIEKQLGRKVSWVLAKGRNNYLSRRRLRLWLESAPTLFEEEPLVPRLLDWVNATREGSLSDWPGLMDSDIWEEVVSDRDNCRGKRCETYSSCFFYEARRQLYQADLIIVNHALFFSNLALGVEGFLPPADIVVFDEAHQLERVASEHLGFRLTEGDVYRLCERLSARRGQRGLLRRYGLAGHDLVENVRQKLTWLFRDLRTWTQDTLPYRVQSPIEISNFLNAPLNELCDYLLEVSEKMGEEGELEIKSQRRKLLTFQVVLDNFLNVSNEHFVYWIEGKRKLQLVSAPVDVSEYLRASLFSRSEASYILTSATLTQADSFDYFCDRLGFEGQTLQVSSPFDLENQMDLVFDSRLEDPKKDSYLDHLAFVLKEHLRAAGPGGIFILFTSHYHLLETATRLEKFVENLGRPLFVQGRDGMDHHLIHQFKNSGQAVLMGTDRFWTGVDVPGQDLETVMITKMPFQYPDHPLNQARCELIKKKGGSAFRDFILPEAILKLRQGLGRLIRRQEDIGRVVILDARVLSKSYGSLVRRSLPHRGRIWKS